MTTEFGYPGCDRRTKGNHRNWCRRNGYAPYHEYLEKSALAISQRCERALELAKAASRKRPLADCRPSWMPIKSWRSYKEYDDNSDKLGHPHITPEEWMAGLGNRVTRGKLAHPGFSKKLNSRFLLRNKILRSKKKQELTPMQFIEWLMLPKAESGRVLTQRKQVVRGSRTIFKRDKNEIIRAILMAATPKGRS